MKLSKDQIDSLFESCTHQEDVLMGLYKMVFPNWDAVKSIQGFPKVSRKTSFYISGKFIEFDKEHHPDVLNGGLWLNSGFSMLDSEDIEDWVVETDEVEVVLN